LAAGALSRPWTGAEGRKGVIPTFEQLEGLFRGRGVKRIHLKALALKQDNEKNQIYLVSQGEANSIINAFPAELNYRNKSQSSSRDELIALCITHPI